jgi:murein DD-endopeptidase MepM/ murein hydrolase activator NlpD
VQGFFVVLEYFSKAEFCGIMVGFMKIHEQHLRISFASAMIGALTLLILPGPAICAVTDVDALQEASVEKVKVRESKPAGPPAASNATSSNALFLFQIQNELKEAYSDYHKLNTVIDRSNEKISSIRDTSSSLRDQIIRFQSEIELTEKKIEVVATQVGLTSKEITLLEEEIVSRSIALDQQKALLADYMRMIYVSENEFGEDGSLSPARMLLADRDIASMLSEMRTLDMLQFSGQEMLGKLRSAQEMISSIQDRVKAKKASLDVLQHRLLAQRASLEDSKMAKAQLLATTHSDEATYKKLIQESEKQQEESALQIAALQNNFNYIRDNLSRLGNSISPTDLQKLLDERTKQLYEYQQMSDSEGVSGKTFQWPIAPNRGLSAYFDDSGYRARFGVDHRAIDIPISQGSAVHAARDGYVYKAKDNGFGYSYILLSHKNGFTTAYGHVSSILVREGQFVTAGTVIGLTGGMPGTRGAGYRTTGPHLHFEVHLRGKPVDPLDYLSLTRLSLEELPAKYAKKIEDVMSGAGEVRDATHPDSSADEADEAMEKQIKEDVLKFVEENGENEIEAYQRIFGKEGD